MRNNEAIALTHRALKSGLISFRDEKPLRGPNTEQLEAENAALREEIERLRAELAPIRSAAAVENIKLHAELVGVQIEKVIEICAMAFGTSVERIKSKTRGEIRVARARQVAMAMVRDLFDVTLKEVGEMFSGRDHGTVIHAIEVVANMATDRDHGPRILRVRAACEQLRRKTASTTELYGAGISQPMPNQFHSQPVAVSGSTLS
jgi:hypothetical protein